MNKRWEFETLLYKGSSGGYFIDIPYDGKTEFGTRGPIRVYAWFEDYKYRTSLAPKGNGKHWVNVKKEIRNSINKDDGDIIRVKIELDTESRIPDIPEDLLWLLENEPDLKEVFDNLAPSLKKQLIDSIISPKTTKTRVSNINKVFKYLNEKRNSQK